MYLASGFHQRRQLRELAKSIQQLKAYAPYEICSSWIWVEGRPERGQPDWDEFAREIAYKNIIDLETADILIVDAMGIAADNNGGVHTELGYCLARSIPIFLVGQRGNTFHWMPNIRQVNSYKELLEALENGIEFE